MDDQTVTNNQQGGQLDPAAALSNILKGEWGEINKPETFLSEGKKLSNAFLKWFVTELRSKNLTDKQILNVLIGLDEGVEKGEVTEEVLNKLTGSEEVQQSIDEEISKHFSEEPTNE